MFPGPEPRDGVWDRTPIKPGGSWLRLAFHSPVHSPADAAEVLICGPPTPNLYEQRKSNWREMSRQGEQPLLMWPKCVSPVGHVDAVEGMGAQSGPSCQQPAEEGCWLPGDPSTQRHEAGAGGPTPSGSCIVGRSQELSEPLQQGPMPEATAGEVLREASVR